MHKKIKTKIDMKTTFLERMDADEERCEVMGIRVSEANYNGTNGVNGS